MPETTPTTIRLTNRLVSWIGEKPFPTLPPHSDPLLDWSASVYELEHDPFIVLINSSTFFSVVIGAEEVVDLASMSGRAFLGVSEYCAHTTFRKRLETGFSSMQFSKIGNASLNTMVTHLHLHALRLLSRGRSFTETSDLINDRPVQSLNYRTPRECFRDLASNSVSSSATKLAS